MKRKLLFTLIALLALCPNLRAQNYSDYYVNIPGDHNNWGDNGVKPNSNNIATHTDLPLGTGGFKVKVWTGSTAEWHALGKGINQDTWVSIPDNLDNMTVNNAVEGQLFNVEYNVADNNILVVSSTMYVIGEVDGTTSFKANHGVKMTYKANGIYEAKNILLNGSFGFSKFIGSKEDDWNTLNKDRFGPSENDTFVKLEGNQTTLTDYNSWKTLEPTGKFDITLDVINKTFTLTQVNDPVFYLRGGMNNWDAIKEWAFTKENGYKIEIDGKNKSIDKGIEFKVSYGVSNDYYYGIDRKINNNIDPSTISISLTDGNNMTFSDDFVGTIELVYDKATPTALKLTDKRNSIYLDLSGVSGWGEPNAYLWKGEDNDKDQIKNAGWPGTKMTKEGNLWKYSYAKDFANIIFNDGSESKQSVDLRLVNGKTYKLGEGKDMEGHYYEYGVTEDYLYNVEDDEYVYFNAGAEYYTNTDEWGEEGDRDERLYAVFYNGAQEVSEEKMTRLTKEKTPIFRAKIPATADGVDFKLIKAKDNTGNKERIFQSTEGDTYRDKDNWAKFIYGLGKDKAYQSYLTYKQYRRIMDDKASRQLYFIGENLYDNDGQEVLDWDYFNLITAEKEEDVYIHEMNFGENSEAQIFKVGFINPELYNTSSPYHFNRWWATFNLGIVGVSRHIYYANGDSQELEPGVGDANQNVAYEAGITTQYNHYNQFNWLVKNVNKTVYMVFDTEFETVVILDFNPQPELSEFSFGAPVLKDLSDIFDPAEDLSAIRGLAVRGSNDANGTARFQKVNVMEGTATIKPADNSDLENHDISYGILYNSEEIGSIEYNGTDEKDITIESLLPGQSGTFAVRATYTDNRYLNAPESEGGEPLQYRSRTVKSATENTVELASLSNPKVKYAKMHNFTATEGDYDAAVVVEFELADAAGLSYYPTYELSADGSDMQATVMTSDHYYAKADDNVDGSAHTPWDGVSTYVDATHNWAEAAKSTKNFYLNVPAVQTGIEDISELQTVTVKGKLYACYPFLINTAQKFSEPDPTPARIAAPRREASKVIPGACRIVTFEKATDEFKYEINPLNEGLSGVESLTYEGTDSQSELFNLQGVRIIESNPAPGIYIRRNADGSAHKIRIF